MKANAPASRCRLERSPKQFGVDVHRASNLLTQLQLSRSRLQALKTQGSVHEVRRANSSRVESREVRGALEWSIRIQTQFVDRLVWIARGLRR